LLYFKKILQIKISEKMYQENEIINFMQPDENMASLLYSL